MLSPIGDRTGGYTPRDFKPVLYPICIHPHVSFSILLPFHAANILPRLICAPPWHVPFCSFMNLLQSAFHICPLNCPIKGTSFHRTQPSDPRFLHCTDHSFLFEILVLSAAFQECFADGPSISWLCLGCPSPGPLSYLWHY